MKRSLLIAVLIIPALSWAQKRVGIGTDNPLQRLSVDSTLNVDQGNFDDGIKPSLRFGDGASGEAIGSRRIAGGTNPFGLNFWAGFSLRMVITNQGHVGIGETSPAYPLNFDTNLGDKVSFYGNSGNHYGIGLQDHLLQFYNENSTSSMAFGTGSSSSFTENVRFTGTGRVGIGLPDPQSPLHVRSTDQIVGFFEGGNNTVAAVNIGTSSNNGSVALLLTRQGVTKTTIGINNNNDFIISKTNPTTGNSNAFSIQNSTGFIGINTITPNTRVHIKSQEPIMTYIEGDDPDYAMLYIDGKSANSYTGIGLSRQNTTKAYITLNAANNLQLMRTHPVGGYLLPAITILNASGNVGIGTTTPANTLDVFDDANTGTVTAFTSNNSSSAFLQINNNSTSTPNNSQIGVRIYRNGSAKGNVFVDAQNALNLSTNTSPQLAISTAGNIGIGLNNAGFPLTFTSALGDKISLYGNSGNHYGFGIGTNALQIHTDINGADIVFGYGSSASLNETVRIKGNGNLQVKGDIIVDVNGANTGFLSPGLRFGTSTSGEGISSRRSAGLNQNGLDLYTDGAARLSVDNNGLVGINESSPGARLQITHPGGNYSNGESSTHALEIWDGAETLYMGADDVNNLSYIQAVGNNIFHTLALNARGGNIALGKSTAAERLDVNGNALFSGNVTVQSNKGIVRNYNSTQLKTETFTYTFSGLVALGANNSNTFTITFPESFSATPAVYVAGLIPSAGSGGYAECVYNISNVTTTGCLLYIYNPRSTGATFNNGSPNFALNLVAVGAQ